MSFIKYIKEHFINKESGDIMYKDKDKDKGINNRYFQNIGLEIDEDYKILEKYLEKIPVDVERLAKELEFKVTYQNFAEIEKEISKKDGFSNVEILGAITINKEEKNIYVKYDDIETTQRFTIAHELGHYFLHKNDFTKEGQFINFRSLTNQKEKEADIFAKNLLMPKTEFKELYQKENKKSFAIIEDFTQKFDVSRRMAKKRWNDMGF